MDFPVQVLEKLAQVRQGLVDIAAHSGGAGATAVLLHDDHALQLAPPGHEIGQLQLFLVLQGAHRGPYTLGIEGQNLGVQLIGLGQFADGFGKVAQGFGVHNDHGQAGLVQEGASYAPLAYGSGGHGGPPH